MVWSFSFTGKNSLTYFLLGSIFSRSEVKLILRLLSFFFLPRRVLSLELILMWPLSAKRTTPWKTGGGFLPVNTCLGLMFYYTLTLCTTMAVDNTTAADQWRPMLVSFGYDFFDYRAHGNFAPAITSTVTTDRRATSAVYRNPIGRPGSPGPAADLARREFGGPVAGIRLRAPQLIAAASTDR